MGKMQRVAGTFGVAVLLGAMGCSSNRAGEDAQPPATDSAERDDLGRRDEPAHREDSPERREPPVSAGMSYETHLALGPLEYALQDARYDVVVATVEKTGAGTNAAPPAVTLVVHDVLRGDAAVARTQALWLPLPHEIDWEGPGAGEGRAIWAATRLEAPAAGTRWILAGQTVPELSGAAFRIAPFARTPYSDEARARAERAIAGELPPWPVRR